MSDAAPSATLDALVPLQAGARGAQPAYVLLNDRLEPAATVSFAALAERAAALAGGLARRGRPGDRVLLTVTDHAGGIAADDLDRVFEAGWRGSGPRTPAPLPQLTAGAGIGLAIARGVVDAHDGDIAAQNTADGCRFTVTLPAA